MGLSVLWASWNIGATCPEEYGNYYSWGEIQFKEMYDWNTYEYYNDSTSTKYTKYSTELDGITTILPEDDAATIAWGAKWRIPSQAEWQELISNSTQSFTTQNGVNGCLIKSNINNNSIFIPAAGFYRNIVATEDYYGYYWSSSLCDSSAAYAFTFSWGLLDTSEKAARCFGRSIRPVCIK